MSNITYEMLMYDRIIWLYVKILSQTLFVLSKEIKSGIELGFEKLRSS